MKLLSSLSVFALALIVLASCGGGGAAGVAKKMCKCSEPLVSMQQDLKDAGDDMAKTQEIMAKYEEEGAKMEECIGEAEEMMGDKKDDEAYGKEVLEAMKDKCPEVYEVMNGGM